ncbi:MAG TPA: aminodeoxychorismate synthase component I [bacterium]|nr:aminodeoxychorismate synthase component I [bacterium]HOM26249.1 aminodeoxychorismate synthase component I [bacterium]
MKIFVENFPYINPEKFYLFICEYPFSFFMEVNWNKIEKYTICGFSPFLIFRSKKRNIEIKRYNQIKRLKNDPISELQKIFDSYKLSSEYFFLPGGFGFLSYDLGWQIEDLPDISEDDLNLPDIFICFYEMILVFDNYRKKAILISSNLEKDRHFNKKFVQIKKFLKKNIEKAKNLRNENPEFKIEKLSQNMSFSRYISSIEKIKNYIKEGDVYQINFSHRFEVKGEFRPYPLFLKLKKINPAPYSAYFNFDDFILISNSPELFLKKQGREIVTKPMKGTRRRLNDKKLDEKIKNDLLESKKDRAELIMIVDLERNDFGKICEYGSVKVKKLINLEKYKTVYQTTSTIEGKLRKDVNLEKIIKAIFPGGSITGAPKKRAMEIIEELEPTKRSFYTGSSGYFGFNENLQLNILIRTLLLKNNKIYYPCGGGIVWDSIPEKEYEETIVKARNLFLTIGIKEDEIRDFVI